MRRAMRGAAKAPDAELDREAKPYAEADQHQPHPSPQHAERGEHQSPEGGVVVPRRRMQDAFAVQFRMLLVEQRVELAFLLLRKADAPVRGPHGMDDDRGRSVDDAEAALEEREEEIRVLAPCGGELLVKSADRFERGPAAENIRRREFRGF